MRDAAPFIGKRVFVYRNLHKKCLSIRYKGRVIGHSHVVQLLDVEFKVGKAGQRRVRETGQKNVHAGVQGILVGFRSLDDGQSNQVYYNPYKTDCFVIHSSGSPIHKAISALITGGRIYVKEQWV